jgi:hypothetical protein
VLRKGAVGLSVLVLAACTIAPRGARLYDVDGTQPVINAIFQGTGDKGARGTVSFTTSAGEVCTGEFSATPSGGTAWGKIFYSNNKGVRGTGSYKSISALWYGSVIAVGSRGTTFECEFQAEPKGEAHGACKDNRGHSYRLMFDAWGTVSPVRGSFRDAQVPVMDAFAQGLAVRLRSRTAIRFRDDVEHRRYRYVKGKDGPGVVDERTGRRPVGGFGG